MRTTRKKAGKAKAGKAGKADIVPTFFQMLHTVKLFHWKTTDYASHKATDELYASLNEHIDTFVEVMLGKEMGSRAKLISSVIKVDAYSTNEAFRKQVEVYKHFLMSLNANLGTDLLAIRDEILAAFNKCLYLMGGNPAASQAQTPQL
jgi:DNA-binding ferritin-like protein